MEFFDVVKERRSIRHYEEGFVVPFDDIKKILEAGMFAPSAMRRFPWEFLVITDQVILQKIEKEHQYASFASSAGVMIAVCEKESVSHAGMGVLDVAMASQNIMLAAHALGYGTCFCGVYPETHEKFNELLQVPKDVRVIGLISLGKPIEIKPTPARYNEFKVHVNRW
ncbi:MAG: nitroreductase family protein [Alphaproteobacteria bacterium]|nr:nitroreductase family protein [Alphaproteobacteria bacterium]